MGCLSGDVYLVVILVVVRFMCCFIGELYFLIFCCSTIVVVVRGHIYIYMLWSYYLGHVWGFLIVTNWATFVFLKRLFVKKHYKNRGFNSFFFKKKGTQHF